MLKVTFSFTFWSTIIAFNPTPLSRITLTTQQEYDPRTPQQAYAQDELKQGMWVPSGSLLETVVPGLLGSNCHGSPMKNQLLESMKT